MTQNPKNKEMLMPPLNKKNLRINLMDKKVLLKQVELKTKDKVQVILPRKLLRQ